MREQIFDLLKRHLVYPEAEIARFASFGQLRFDSSHNQLQKETNRLLSNQDNVLQMLLVTQEKLPNADKGLFKLDNAALLNELKRLDFKCLQDFLTNDINPEMKKYLTIFAEEAGYPKLFSPSSKLTNAEFKMFQYIMNQSFEEECDKVCDIANRTIRIMLQEWLLYPELVTNKEEAETLITALSCSNINFN